VEAENRIAFFDDLKLIVTKIKLKYFIGSECPLPADLLVIGNRDAEV